MFGPAASRAPPGAVATRRERVSVLSAGLVSEDAPPGQSAGCPRGDRSHRAAWPSSLSWLEVSRGHRVWELEVLGARPSPACVSLGRASCPRADPPPAAPGLSPEPLCLGGPQPSLAPESRSRLRDHATGRPVLTATTGRPRTGDFLIVIWLSRVLRTPTRAKDRGRPARSAVVWTLPQVSGWRMLAREGQVRPLCSLVPVGSSRHVTAPRDGVSSSQGCWNFFEGGARPYVCFLRLAPHRPLLQPSVLGRLRVSCGARLPSAWSWPPPLAHTP